MAGFLGTHLIQLQKLRTPWAQGRGLNRRLSAHTMKGIDALCWSCTSVIGGTGTVRLTGGSELVLFTLAQRKSEAVNTPVSNEIPFSYWQQSEEIWQPTCVSLWTLTPPLTTVWIAAVSRSHSSKQHRHTFENKDFRVVPACIEVNIEIQEAWIKKGNIIPKKENSN